MSPHQGIKEWVLSGNIWSNMSLSLTAHHSVPHFPVSEMGEVTGLPLKVCQALRREPGADGAPNSGGGAEPVPATSRAPPSPESQGFLWRGLFFPFCGEGGEKWSREAGEEEGEGAGRESWLQTEAPERLGTAPRGHVPPPAPGMAPGHCWHPSSCLSPLQKCIC